MPQHKGLRTFDLNLLKTFIAIWDARSLTVAGEQLGLTQPAISHTLKRLREQFDDPLFVRVGNEMVPTEVAVQLYAPLTASLQIVEQALLGQRSFRPAEANRTFHLAMTDVSEYYFLSEILRIVRSQAPNVKIETINLDVTSIHALLKSGKTDIAIGYIPETEDYTMVPLIYDRHVCIVRKDHPFPGDELTVEDFAGLTFVDVSRRVPGYGVIEQHLSDLHLERNVAARLSHLSVLPEMVRNTDLAALFPASVVSRFVSAGDFRVLGLPFDLPQIPISVHTHKRFAADPAIAWLRNAISIAFGGSNAAGGERCPSERN
ncbi:MAG TPA: LysR family transcriptional regulator [Novosphingobium sp.]|nr:LysR family transcriptional regulator [Novosphingobium sp.]